MNTGSAIEKNSAEWAEFFAQIGEPSYRAGQMCAWLWKRGVFDPNEMTDFSKPLREKLTEALDFYVPRVVNVERSSDGTRKFLLEMSDGVKVECALMKQGPRLSACLSSQAGCPVGCPFCSTGISGFERNLTKGEIASQFAVMEKSVGRQIQSIVFMGMGEPFLNMDEVVGAIAMLNDKKMREIGIRHMTVSTAGIVPGIMRLADEGPSVRLAVSLHAPTDELRAELVPCSSRYPLAELMDSLRYYQEHTGDRITIEYSLFASVNDTIQHARKLVALLRGIKAYVNLIPGNATASYKTSLPQDTLKFQSVLKSAGIESEIRTPKGRDIHAACGQLKLSQR